MEPLYTYRYIARIIIEAATPLLVGSGNETLLTDITVQKDLHDLPMIQGTSLLGVLRHSIEDFIGDEHEDKKLWNDIFGCVNGKGARLKVSSAYFVDQDGKVAEKIGENNVEPNVMDKLQILLPSRQHVRISHKGSAEHQGLFNNELVYKGARFIFELSLVGTKEDEVNAWNPLLNKLADDTFRIGQGTRNGYGKLKVIELKTRNFDLTNPAELEAYQEFDPSLNNTENFSDYRLEKSSDDNFNHYHLEIRPDDFFIFSQAAGGNDVDNSPYEEEVMIYENNAISFKNYIVMPGTSIKGAIAHRVAYHYNKIKGNFIEEYKNEKEQLKIVGTQNEAVRELFGIDAGSELEGKRGRVILDDIFINANDCSSKIFNHVAIDRFTGGGIDGALFDEKVTQYDGTIDLHLTLIKDESIKDDILKALENTLRDICSGLLPLGGMTNKGHGFFTGNLTKNEECIYKHIAG